ncbi:FAD/NAD(P)-binding protein [Blastococcus sp. SYSU DS0973]
MGESETMEPREHDLVFVGAGASTSYVLMSLLDTLLDVPTAPPLRIGVVERAPDPFTGVPYGSRAARTSLLITALRDFLPAAERARFTEWLSANKDWAFDEFLSAAGPFSARWWERHEDEIRNDRFDALFLPRYVFGEYLARRTRESVARAETVGVASTEVVHDEVVSIDPAEGGYLISCRGRTLRARRVVLATGSAPVLPRLESDLVGRLGAVLVDDPFSSMSTAVERVRAAVARRPEDRPPHVVMIGANAGTMDMLYQLNNMADGVAEPVTFTVIAPSGQLPERIDDLATPRPFTAQRLEALQDADVVDAQSIYLAAVDDIERGQAAGLSVTDTLAPISQAVVHLLPRLSDAQTGEFADRWGVELGKRQRRAGWEYCEVVDHLAAEGRLRVVAGSFVDVVADEPHQVRARYHVDGVLHRLEPPADAVVNCGGPGRSLQQTAPPLLTQLIINGLCRLTPSGGGVAVDTSLAAAPGLFVMGPLVAGNVVNGAPVWHMEHCGRISAFGAALGADLARTLVTSAG